jgi:hypothetical protein
LFAVLSKLPTPGFLALKEPLGEVTPCRNCVCHARQLKHPAADNAASGNGGSLALFCGAAGIGFGDSLTGIPIYANVVGHTLRAAVNEVMVCCSGSAFASGTVPAKHSWQTSPLQSGTTGFSKGVRSLLKHWSRNMGVPPVMGGSGLDCLGKAVGTTAGRHSQAGCVPVFQLALGRSLDDSNNRAPQSPLIFHD